MAACVISAVADVGSILLVKHWLIQHCMVIIVEQTLKETRTWHCMATASFYLRQLHIARYYILATIMQFKNCISRSHWVVWVGHLLNLIIIGWALLLNLKYCSWIPTTLLRYCYHQPITTITISIWTLELDARYFAPSKFANVTTYINRLAVAITEHFCVITSAAMCIWYKDLGTMPECTLLVRRSSIQETIDNPDKTGLDEACSMSYIADHNSIARNYAHDETYTITQNTKSANILYWFLSAENIHYATNSISSICIKPFHLSLLEPENKWTFVRGSPLTSDNDHCGISWVALSRVSIQDIELIRSDFWHLADSLKAYAIPGDAADLMKQQPSPCHTGASYFWPLVPLTWRAVISYEVTLQCKHFGMASMGTRMASSNMDTPRHTLHKPSTRWGMLNSHTQPFIWLQICWLGPGYTWRSWNVSLDCCGDYVPRP